MKVFGLHIKQASCFCMTAETDAQLNRLRNRTFVVTYLPDRDTPFCQLVFNMPYTSSVSDMIVQLPYFDICDPDHLRDQRSFDRFGERCRVFQVHSTYVGSQFQYQNANLSLERAHAQLLTGSWTGVNAQDILIVWKNDEAPEPLQLYMRHELRALDAQGRPVIAPIGNSAGFEATQSRLDDMSQSLKRLLNKV